MIDQKNTLEEIIDFTDKIYLLESRMRQLLITNYLFDSAYYFNSIENLLNEHKLNIRNIEYPFKENTLSKNKFEHNAL